MREEINDSSKINDEYLQTCINYATENQNSISNFKKSICELYAISYRNSSRPEDKELAKKIAMDLFIELLDPNDTKVLEYISFTTSLFQILNAITPKKVADILDDADNVRGLYKAHNVLEVTMNYFLFMLKDEYMATRLIKWCQQLAEDFNHLSASYHYAAYLHDKIIPINVESYENRLQIKKIQSYYWQALSGGEYRAGMHLHDLFCLVPGLIPEEKLTHSLMQGALAGNQPCILHFSHLYLKTKKRWDSQAEMVWMIQLAASLIPCEKSFKAIEKNTKQAGKHLYVHCAYAALIAKQNESLALTTISDALKMDPDIVKKYIQKGKMSGLCRDAHVEIFDKLLKQVESKKIDVPRLRKRI